MPFVSVTRLRLRALRFVPGFAVHAIASQRQVRRAPGFLGGALLPDRDWTFWTLTLWDTAQSMRAYMLKGAHKAAMPKLLNWCDEASVAHWDQPEARLPSWQEADLMMRQMGRPSKVRYPSPHHADMSFAAPRINAGGTITPASKAV